MEIIKRKCKVVMMSTNDKTNIQQNKFNKLFYSEQVQSYSDTTNQHLYIISDEGIKEGDAVYNNEEISICKKQQVWVANKAVKYNQGLYKIIASTDKSLNLPSISQAFQEEYCKSNGIHEVIVDYVDLSDYDDNHPTGQFDSEDLIIRLYPNDEIFISKVKDTYTKEEVATFIGRMQAEGINKKMEIKESKIKRTSPIGDLEKGKCRITFNGQNAENIWVAKDKENRVMYLLNNALGFYPFPSWGMEFPLSSTLDLGEIRGETPDDTKFVLCEEAYKEISKFIKDDNLDIPAYLDSLRQVVEDVTNDE